MKLKHLALLSTLVLSSLSVFSCQEREFLDVFISEFYSGEDINDCVLELGSNSKEAIKLDDFEVRFYSSSKLKYTLSLKDYEISNSKLILIKNKESLYEDEINTLVTLDDNYLYGKFGVELVQNNEICDVIGTPLSLSEFCTNQSMIRLKEFTKVDGIYDAYKYIKVRSGVTKYLGNLDVPISYEELLNGPKLEERYGNKPVIDGKASGGYCSATVKYLGDGDTTYFNYESGSEMDNSNRVRYLLIDTPEVDHGDDGLSAEKYGNEAKAYNNTRLKNASKIYVQTCKDSALTETYGRYLGFVRYSLKENPTLDDMVLLNIEMLKAGLAKFYTRDKYVMMYSRDILYHDYAEHALNYARKEKLYIHEDNYDPKSI